MYRLYTITTLLLLVMLFQQCTRNPQNSSTETLFKLQTFPCFGECPVYTITISQDGSYTYIGERHVEIQGQKSGELDNKQLKKVKDLISKNRFFEVTVENNYQIQDLPEKIIQANLDGESRELNYYYPKVEELDLIMNGITEMILKDIQK